MDTSKTVFSKGYVGLLSSFEHAKKRAIIKAPRNDGSIALVDMQVNLENFFHYF
jgi:hypothetical protein